jgi:hypothetical protein
MNMQATWLIKLILSHLLTDFILQPGSWIESRKAKHFLSPQLYLHGLLTAMVALAFIGPHYWLIVTIIMVTHILIDGWKSYKPPTTTYFLTDQALHLAVILLCWYFTFFTFADIKNVWAQINTQKTLTIVTAYVLVTIPAGILIGQLTKKWREKIVDGETLGSAGKWIGVIERIIILTLIFNNQYEAIGLLIAAKGLLRFNEANRPEIKTEYLLIGTLISISIALIAGLVALRLLNP